MPFMASSAIIYARFSSTEQGKGYSLERQIGNGRQFIEERGWTLESILRDEGRSAFSGANRQVGSALHAFESEARDGIHHGKTLCVENVDRLSRQGAKQAAQLIWSLNECGVDVATWQDGIVYRSDTNGDLMELFGIIIKSQMAHEESLKKSQRTRDSWSKRYAEIRSGSKQAIAARTPAWIDVTDGKYIINDHRTSVLNEIYDLYIDGVGIHRIVQILNGRNEPVWNKVAEKRGGGWYLAYVHRLLNHRAVMGEYVTVGGEIIATDHYPQAVSAEKFNQAQATRTGKRSTGGGDRTRINNLLSGMVRCGVCGGTAGYENKGANRTAPYTKRDGTITLHKRKLYERLRCDANRRKRGCENSSLFDYQVIEDTVLSTMASAIFPSRNDHPELAKLRKDIAEKGRQVDATSKQIQNLLDAIADGSSNSVIERIRKLEEDMEAKSARLSTLKRIEALFVSLPDQADDVEAITRFRSKLRSSDFDTRYKARSATNQALKRLAVEITLNADDTFTVASEGTSAQVHHKNGQEADALISKRSEPTAIRKVEVSIFEKLISTIAGQPKGKGTGN